MRSISLLVLMVLVWSPVVLSQKPDDMQGTIIPGRQISFVLKEPTGWVLDTRSGRQEGVEAVLYREGSSWSNGVVVMYARVIHKDDTQDTVAKVISNDVTDFMKLSKESKVADSPSLQTRDKKSAIVKTFYDAANKNHESVAFIDEAKVVVILALSSRDKAEYEKALPAFQALVNSYLVFTPLTPSQ